MEQLLAHLVGDYVLQNHWMAMNKTRRWSPAAIHALLYGLPFLLLVDNPTQWLVVVCTHLVIDRFRIARYWVDFWGNGKEGQVYAWLMRRVNWHRSVDNTHWERQFKPRGEHHEATEYHPGVEDAPPFLGVWLLILVDNTMHLIINYATLRWL